MGGNGKWVEEVIRLNSDNVWEYERVWGKSKGYVER